MSLALEKARKMLEADEYEVSALKRGRKVMIKMETRNRELMLLNTFRGFKTLYFIHNQS